MTVSRINRIRFSIFAVALVVIGAAGFGLNVAAQNAAPDTAPVLLTPPTAPVAVAPPVLAVAPAAPATAAPVVTERAASFMAPVPAPVAAPVAATTAPAPTPDAKPQEIKPGEAAPAGKEGVEVAVLAGVDPQSIGLLGAKESLGATLWKGTPLSLVDSLMPALILPTSSLALNSLADRLFLTASPPPEGDAAGNPNLLTLRIQKLLALGDAKNAWKLATAAKPDLIDDAALRQTAEAALLTSDHDALCAKLPDIIKTHSDIEWQKLLLVCQLGEKDAKAAQVTLDLLHAQNVRDDAFFFIVEKNLMTPGKQLPHQLTPLQPLILALLRMTDLPLPPELYMHPGAAMIPQLIEARAREDGMRLNLAEHAAERGVITPAQLATAYRSISFTADAMANVNGTAETGPRLRALLYQVALQEKTAADAKDPAAAPMRRITDAIRFLHTADAPLLGGAGASLMAEMVDGIEPSEDYNAVSGALAHIYVLAGKPDRAMAWIKQAKHAEPGMPGVGSELQSIWPLIVLGGFESDADFAADLAKWMDFIVPVPDPKADPKSLPDLHAPREQAVSVLMLLDAAGFTAPDAAWARVMNAPSFEKHMVPPALLFERLRMASAAGRRGESVLLALAMASVPTPGNGGGVSGSNAISDTMLLTVVETIRALRLVGLTADAAALARESALDILTPKASK
jgi:hypothetical protein